MLLRKVRLEMDRKSISLEQNSNNVVKRCRIFQVDDSSCNTEKKKKKVDDVGFLA
jgi:hypothetical protein